jgi:uncharacterized repeat protein (TIGR04138 family)
VESQSQLDWQMIRKRAASFPEEAFQFLREGLQHTSKMIHGDAPPPRMYDPDEPEPANDSRRHVSGQQLCLGLRDLAIKRYGLLAHTVLSHWNVQTTDDFGLLVYGLVDRGELRTSVDDSPADFHAVFEFDEAFPKSL